MSVVVNYPAAGGGFGTATTSIINNFINTTNVFNNTTVTNNYSTTTGNFILSGGGIVWDGGLTYTISGGIAMFMNTPVPFLEQTITLDAADPSDPRIDVIALNSGGNVVDIEGTPGATPEKPDVDPADELELTFVYLPAGATAPGVTQTDVYHENTEWTTSKVGGARINLASTNNPFDGTVCIQGTAAQTGDYARAQAPSAFDPVTKDTLGFRFKMDVALPAARSVSVTLRSAGAQRGQLVSLFTGKYGFNGALTAGYQSVVIPVRDFAADGLSVNQLQLTVAGSGTTLNFHLDDIVFQSGLLPTLDQTALHGRGDWSATAQYSMNDVVTYNNSLYVAIQSNNNVAPTVTTSWKAYVDLANYGKTTQSNSWAGQQYSQTQNLGSLTGTVTINALSSNVYDLTQTGNMTLANPTNLADGMEFSIRVTIGGAGGYTIAYGAAWNFIAGQPTWPTTVGDKVELTCTYYGSTGTLEAVANVTGGAGTLSPLTTKGDVYGYSTVNARIPVGTNGQVLTADSAQALGVKWSAPAGTGDVVGPGASTNNDFAQWNGTTGALLKDGGLSLDTDGTMSANSTARVPSQSAVVSYIATFLSNFDAKPEVAYASTSALPSNTYSNGTSGVGATLTGTANGPLLIDGVTLVAGAVDLRILVGGEVVDARNGWYTLTQLGVIAVSPYILTRDPISDQAAEIKPGYITAVEAPTGLTGGSANNGKLFLSVCPSPFVVGTDSLTFTAVGAAGGTVTSVAASVPSIFSIAGSPITGSGTLAMTYSGTALPVANGGTGITSFGTGIATWLGTPSSANLAAAVTDETGSGALVFGTSPTLVTPALGTPTALVLTSATGAVGANFGTKTANFVFAGPTSGSAANPDFRALVAADINGLQGTGLTANDVGFRQIPQNSQSAAYTTVAADSGKHILHPSGDANARTFTIDSNANVAYPVGTAITFVNQTSQVVTIAITSDTMTLAGSTTTGSRSLAQNGVATALKITSTAWIISGTGLT